MKRIALVSKITRGFILLGLSLHTAIFILFVISNLDTPLLATNSADDKVNVFAINDGWSHYAVKLSQQGVNSFWLFGTVDFIAQFLIAFFMFRLFGLYESGKVFSYQNSLYLQRIGIILLGYTVLLVFLPFGFSLAYNYFSGSTPLKMELYFGSTELSQLVVGLVVVVISWIMQEASMLKKEQDLVI